MNDAKDAASRRREASIVELRIVAQGDVRVRVDQSRKHEELTEIHDGRGVRTGTGGRLRVSNLRDSLALNDEDDVFANGLSRPVDESAHTEDHWTNILSVHHAGEAGEEGHQAQGSTSYKGSHVGPPTRQDVTVGPPNTLLPSTIADKGGEMAGWW